MIRIDGVNFNECEIWHITDLKISLIFILKIINYLNFIRQTYSLFPVVSQLYNLDYCKRHHF